MTPISHPGRMLGSAALTLLIALSVHRSHALGHDRTMYDPIYCWRESFAVALSRLREEPLIK